MLRAQKHLSQRVFGFFLQFKFLFVNWNVEHKANHELTPYCITNRHGCLSSKTPILGKTGTPRREVGHDYGAVVQHVMYLG